jgi:thiol-disulfide isomerase/thioredoxin
MYRKEHVVTLGIIVAVLLIGLLYTWMVISEQKIQQAKNNPATKALTGAEGESLFTDLSGNTVNFDDHLGKVLVINTWASWSPDSARELPELVTLVGQYSDQRIEIVAINRGESRETAQRFLQTVGVSESLKLILDPEDKFYKSIQGYAMPETIVYDQKGNIVYHARGAVKMNELQGYIDTALNGGM